MYNNTMPAKTASPSLLDIESTIPTRLNLNIQFLWWCTPTRAISTPHNLIPNTFKKLHLRCIQHLEEDFRHNLIDKKCDIETSKIKRYVGEFY